MKKFLIILGCIVLVGGVYYVMQNNLMQLPQESEAKQVSTETQEEKQVPSEKSEAERVPPEPSEKKVVIVYGTPYCSYCTLAKELLDQRGIHYIDKDVTEMGAREEMARCAPNAKTIPQIVIGNVHIGGYGELKELDLEGKLEKMVAGES